MLEMAEGRQSTEFFALAKQIADRLIAQWGGHVPDFGSVRRLLQKISTQKWVLGHGGKEVYRRLLDGMLEHVRFASAADWIELLALPDEALHWTAGDKSSLASEFKSYCDDGVGDDRRNCTTVDEMNGLIESLTELGQKTSHDFSYEIDQLSESIAEREEEKPKPAERDDTPSGTSFAAPAVVATADDVREMFSTLRAEDPEVRFHSRSHRDKPDYRVSAPPCQRKRMPSSL